MYQTVSEIAALGRHRNGADAALLLNVLRLAHWDHPRFAASPKAMAREQVLSGWGPQRYRDALADLIGLRLLDVVHKGGRGAHDPRLFTFASPVMVKGAGSGPNIIKHPPPCLSPSPTGVQGPEGDADQPHSARRPSQRRVTPSAVTDTDTHLADALSNPVGETSINGDPSDHTPSVTVVGGDGQLDLIEFIGGPPAPRRAADPRAFGAALREARTRLQLSQKVAAWMAGLSRSGFGNIETGEYPPSPETVSRLAEVFGVRLASVAIPLNDPLSPACSRRSHGCNTPSHGC